MSYLNLSKTPNPVIEDPELLVALNNLRRYEDRRPILALPLPISFLQKEQKFAFYQRLIKETRYHKEQKDKYPNYIHKIILNKTEYKLHEENKKRLENSLNQLQYLPYKSIAVQDQKYYFPSNTPSRTYNVFVTDTDCRFISTVIQSTCNSVTTITASHSFHLSKSYNDKLSHFNPHRTSSPIHFDPNGTSGTAVFEPILTQPPISPLPLYQRAQDSSSNTISIYPSLPKPIARRSLYPDLSKMTPPKSPKLISPKKGIERSPRSRPLGRDRVAPPFSPCTSTDVTPTQSPTRSPNLSPLRSPSVSPIKTETQFDPLTPQLGNLNLIGTRTSTSNPELFQSSTIQGATGPIPVLKPLTPSEVKIDYSGGAIPKLSAREQMIKQIDEQLERDRQAKLNQPKVDPAYEQLLEMTRNMQIEFNKQRREMKEALDQLAQARTEAKAVALGHLDARYNATGNTLPDHTVKNTPGINITSRVDISRSPSPNRSFSKDIEIANLQTQIGDLLNKFNNMTTKIQENELSESQKNALTKISKVVPTEPSQLIYNLPKPTNIIPKGTPREPAELRITKGHIAIATLGTFDPDKDKNADFREIWDRLLNYTQNYELYEYEYIDLLMVIMKGSAGTYLTSILKDSEGKLDSVIESIQDIYIPQQTIFDDVDRLNKFTRGAKENIKAAMRRASLLINKLKPTCTPEAWPERKYHLSVILIKQIITDKAMMKLHTKELEAAQIGNRLDLDEIINIVYLYEQAHGMPKDETKFKI